jgi:hypothetical protein
MTELSITGSALLLAVSTAAAFTLLSTLAALACAVLFRIKMLIPSEVPDARATLILPATGPLPDLANLFRDLRRQTLRPARLIVAVESREDPAYDRVASELGNYPELPIELVVAGLSAERGQKCTNLLAALERLGSADDYVVTFDADIRPQPWWLASLVAPMAAGQADIVNGYRWQVPQRLSFFAALVAAIDRGIAVLLRLTNIAAVWGGSLAFTRSALARLDLPRLMARTAAEDGVIGLRAEALGLRVLTRRGLRLPTPLNGSFLSLWRFARRQYQLVRIYRPGVWILVCLFCTADLLARAMLVMAALAAGGLTARLAIAALALLGCLGSATVQQRLGVGRRLGVVDPVAFVMAQHVLVWSFLTIAAFHAAAVWAGFFYSPMVWAHVRYRIDRQGQVVSAVRSPYGG